jgi:membrane fusion protein (multidrug efflux system)
MPHNRPEAMWDRCFRLFTALIYLITPLSAQHIDLVPVVSRPVSKNIELPGELLPFLNVSIHARVSGYVERVLVDRGSMVKQGDPLIELTAPEMQAQIAEAESKGQAAEAEKLQAESQLAATQSTYEGVRRAAETPGAIAGNEVVQTEKQMDAAKALVNSREKAVHAAEAMIRSLREMQSYLKISAPFDGVVTDRLVHPGALVGPGAGDAALLVIQQISRLRLVVAVPEEDTSGITSRASVEFRVPAWPDRIYSGTIARSSHALDARTRSMAVELDVLNRDGSLSPGMYPAVKWPVRRSRPALLVPKSSVVTTTERTFVIRDHNGHAEWVDVRKNEPDGDLMEVSGNLRPADLVVRVATDEMREGTVLQRATK